MKNMFRDKKHAEVLGYLETWGKSFWEDTDYRIHELTSKLEAELRDSIGAKLPGLSGQISGALRLTKEEKAEIANRAQTVINNVQIRQLSQILDWLEAVLDDPQKRYYVVIDRLDENWIEDKLRYRLIRALIETARDFRKVHNAKIIIALRLDLLERVFRLTRDTGFQEEKYESLYLPISWSRERLTEVLDARIDFLVKQRYTKHQVRHQDIFPKAVFGKQPTIKYILDRTLLRPRDVLQFVNYCIDQAVDHPAITQAMIKEAEGIYSRSRLRSLADEWNTDYPNLLQFVDILKNRPSGFAVSDISENECAALCLELVVQGFETSDILSESANQVVDCVVTSSVFRALLVAILYRVGLIGLKLESYEPVVWTMDGRRSISQAEVEPKTRISIHQCFWRTLGIKES